MQITESAFPIGTYSKNSTGVAERLAHYVIEASSERRDEERIVPIRLEIRNKEVIDPVRDQGLKDQYRTDTSQRRTEAEIGWDMVEKLQDSPIGTMSVWISPPGGENDYIQARAVVYSKISDEEIKGYGMPLRATPGQCLNYFARLTEFSEGNFNLQNPEQLRGQAITLSNQSWDLLEEIIPSKCWQKIKSGEAERNFSEKILPAAQKVVAKNSSRMAGAWSFYEQLAVGARLEQDMARETGYQAKSGPCGKTNGDLLRQSKTLTVTLINLNEEGEIVSNGTYVEKCPLCDAGIQKIIYKGDVCRDVAKQDPDQPEKKCGCDGIFQGCG